MNSIEPFLVSVSPALCDEEFEYELRNGILVQRAASQLVRAEIEAEDFLEIADFYLPGRIDQYIQEVSDNIEQCLLLIH